MNYKMEVIPSLSTFSSASLLEETNEELTETKRPYLRQCRGFYATSIQMSDSLRARGVVIATQYEFHPYLPP